MTDAPRDEEKLTERIDPCPCCGSKAIEHAITDEESENWNGRYIECTNVSCRLSSRLGFPCPDDPMPGLRYSWNKRHRSPDTELPSRDFPAEMATIWGSEELQFKKEVYGANVATLLDNEHEIVEIVKRTDGTFDFIVHNRDGETDRWNEKSATLTKKHMALLGRLAATLPEPPQ